MRKWILALLLMVPIMGLGQTSSFFTDRAVGSFPVNHMQVLIPISYGQVRVCSFPAIGSPCVNPASVTDLSGTPLTVLGGNFGQITTDVVGRFSFGCAPGIYQVQVAASSSNTPQLNYPIVCSLPTGNPPVSVEVNNLTVDGNATVAGTLGVTGILTGSIFNAPTYRVGGVPQSGTGPLASTISPVFTTPSLGAAIGTSLSLGGGTALTTTNQTGSNNIVLSTAPSITNPSITGTDSGNETLISKVLLGTGVSNSVTLLVACKFDNSAAVAGAGATPVNIFICTFPANVLAAGKCFHTRGSWQHTTGGAGVTYVFTFGAQTQAAAADAGTGVVTWDIAVCNKSGVTNAQTITGIAGFDGITPIFGNIFLAGTNDMTTGITMKFTFTVAATDQVTPLQMITWIDQ